jgi:pimeloyl-ACP methyl ester carboxylesterase
MSTVERRSTYLLVDPDPVFAAVHLPTGNATPGPRTGVLFCPPFGWDEICAYRSLRTWADACANAGFPTLRIDLPGSGDSAGAARDPQRLQRSIAAVSAGAAWLRAEGGCDRVVAIGIGLGGQLALAAASGGAAIDDLVLWSVPARGRLLVRELRAFARMAAAEREADAPPESDDGTLEVSGYVLAPETLHALEQLDLTELMLPDAAGRRILLLGRETLPPDAALREHLERSGAAVEVADGPGYDSMTTHPQWAETPREVIERTTRWIAAGAGAPPSLAAIAPVAGADHIEFEVAGKKIRETVFDFDQNGARHAGVLTQPADAAHGAGQLCAVLLNAGSVRRSGPNRMWTETARRWAAAGVPTLRFDGARIGDTDGDEREYFDTRNFYEPQAAEQVLAAFDALEQRGIGERFLVAGLCAGAYWAVESALADDRVCSLVLMNLAAFGWSDELVASRDARHAAELLRQGNVLHIVRRAASDGRLLRLARTRSASVLRKLVRSERSGGPHDYSAEVIELLERRGVRTLMLYSRGDPLAGELQQTGLYAQLEQSPNFHVEELPLADHTVRAVWAQRHVNATLDRELSWLGGLAAPPRPMQRPHPRPPRGATPKRTSKPGARTGA